MSDYLWDVQLPGEDLPHRVETDYVLTDGEEITVDGLPWIVEHVELSEESAPPTGVVMVAPAHGPLSS